MKRSFYVLVLLLLQSYLFGGNTFVKTIGGADDDVIYDGLVANNNYYFFGYTRSFGNNMDGYILKLADNGTVLTEKAIDLGQDELFHSAVMTPEGDFLVVGYTRQNESSPTDVLIVKLTKDFNVQWSKTIGGDKNDNAYTIQPLPDGNYIVSGSTHSFGAGDEDVYLIKINSRGDTLWSTTFGGTREDEGRRCAVNKQGQIFVTAKSVGLFSTPDMYMIKTDTNGSALWLKTFSSMGWTEGYDVCTVDTCAVFAGYGYWGSGYSHDILLVKVNAHGDTMFTRHYGGSADDYAFGICPTHDGGFVLTGKSHSFGYSFDGFLCRVDTNGNLQWFYGFGGDKDDIFWNVLETPDHYFIALGFTSSNTAGGTDAFIVKTDSLGLTTALEQSPIHVPQTIALGQNYPNPFNPTTTIPFTLDKAQNVTIEIFSSTGKKIAILGKRKFPAGNHILSWNGRDAQGMVQPSGIYFYRLVMDGHVVAVRKMILMR